MKEFYMFLGSLIDNYVVLIIVFCVLIKVISIPLKLVLSKQQKEKAERDTCCRALYVQYGEDKDKLTDEIYKYYKSSKYNPLIYFSLKTVIIVINILLILLMVGTFKPISNFTNISEQEKTQIIKVYQSREGSAHYQEISLLNELDDMKRDLTDNGVSDNAINTLYGLKDKFSIFDDVPMYEIPSFDTLNWGSVVLFVALGTSFARIIPPIRNCIRRRNEFKTMGLSAKQKFIASPVIAVLTFVLSISIILNTPLVICFYFIFQYLYALSLEVIKMILNYRKAKETSPC